MSSLSGVVSELHPQLCTVIVPGHPKILCSYRRSKVIREPSLFKGKKKDFRPEEIQKERSPVAVGDQVQIFLSNPGQGVVDSVIPRKNALIRPAPARDNQVQVIAANIDYLVIVASATQPDFNSGIVDRFLILAHHCKITPLLVITKQDLLGPSSSALSAPSPWDIYRKLGYRVFEVSNKNGQGIEELKTTLAGVTTAFCGHSGVGKSSLLNTLLGQDVQKIGDISEFASKGKHTTTNARMIHAAGTTYWIDTPGIRELSLTHIPLENLCDYYPEWSTLPCQKAGCLHTEDHQTDPCDVAIQKNTAWLGRYSNYLKIWQSTREDLAFRSTDRKFPSR